MKYRRYLGLLVVCTVLCGCSRDVPSEIVGNNLNEYVDSINLSDLKRLNYDGYFIGEAVSVEDGIELSNELDGVSYGWSWEMVQSYDDTDKEEPEETNGTAKSIKEILDKNITLSGMGEVYIYPNYIGDEAESGSEDSETLEGESLQETIKKIQISNYGSSDLSLKDCISRGWYTIILDNYYECFNIELSDVNDMVNEISTKLGNPTVIWEENARVTDSKYVAGERVNLLAYEFPDYTITLEVTSENGEVTEIDSLMYIPKSVWLGGEGFKGMRYVYSRDYVEVDKSVLPEYN